MKKLILALCVVLSGAVVTAQESSPNVALSVTSGGHDGSGGNALGSSKADPAQIAKLISSSAKLETICFETPRIYI